MTQSTPLENEAPEWEYQGVRLQMSSVPDDEKQVDTEFPSFVDGLTSQQEYDLRIVGCELIQLSGQLLKLPQVAMATGQVLFQRFFYTKSLVRHDYEHYAMGCIHLAAKIEECPRRLRDTINVFHHMRQAREQRPFKPLIPDQSYVNLKNQVIKAERRVLKELGFCVHVKHPHKLIVCYLQFLGEEMNSNLVQCAWNFMNDSLRTKVFVCYYPETIACACIYLAARQLKIPLPEGTNPEHCWWNVFRVKESSIRAICLEILHLYSRAKPKTSELEARLSDLHEKRRQQLEKRQRQREVANAKASNGNAASNDNNTRNQHRIIPGALITANSALASQSGSSANNRASGRRSSSIEEKPHRRSHERSRKHRNKKGRRDRRKSASRSRTPKAYRYVSRSRSRSPSRSRRTSKEKYNRSRSRRRRNRSYSSSSRSPSTDRQNQRKYGGLSRKLRSRSDSRSRSRSPIMRSSGSRKTNSSGYYSSLPAVNGRTKIRRN